MVRRGKERIIVATGPYHIVKSNIEDMLPVVKYRHFKADEIKQAKAWIRQYHYEGAYFFDWYLMNTAAEAIIYRMQPLDIVDATPWMYRIDAVVQRPGKDLIVEFTDRLRSTSIGQLTTYQELYEKDTNQQGKTLAILVVYDDEPTLHPILDRLGIILHVVKR